ncbi:MAG: AMP-binding protein [Alphaproteobacteria bacterium]|nr:AMP-binding protein [Alphaproteobacteria bacterium]
MRGSSLPFLPAAAPAADDAPALCDDAGIWLTYGELRAKTHDLGRIFSSDTRKLIFCCVPRSVEGALAYLGAAASGHAVGMVDSAMPYLDSVIATYQPDWLIAAHDRDFDGYVPITWSLNNLRLLQRKNPGEGTLHPDFYLLLLTSGSTGSSKGVRLSYANLASNTQAIIASLSLTADTRALAHLPLFYSFGLSVLHTQLAVGACCVLTEHSMMNRDFWKLAREQKASLFPGVPYHYEMLAKLRLNRIDAPDLKIFLQAGGKMREELVRDLWKYAEQRQGKFFVMYGQTEASPRISCLPMHEHAGKIGSCGRALPGGMLSIEDSEVIYTGPNVMMGYAESRADLARGDEMKNRLATGDMGQLDSQGYLTILGRKQRFAKLFGQRIALDDLEKIAGTVAPAVAMEAEDRIILVTSAQEAALHQRMQELVAKETGLPLAWLSVRAVETIPHSGSGKIDYRKLREML